MPSPYHNLKEQRAVLEAREAAMTAIPETSATRIRSTLDAAWRAKLLALSPGGLAPVIVSRNHGEFFAAYLIMEFGKGSHRLLLVENQWAILRCKRSARVYQVRGKRGIKLHGEVVRLQGQVKARLTELMEDQKWKIQNQNENGDAPKVSTARATPAVRGWRPQKSKRRIGKSS